LSGKRAELRIGFWDPSPYSYNVETPFQAPLGGTQSALCYLAIELAAMGHEVATFTLTDRPGRIRGVECVDRAPGVKSGLLGRLDVLIINYHAIGRDMRRQLKSDVPLVLWTQHNWAVNTVADLANPAERDCWAGFALVSAWQLEGYRRRLGLPAERAMILRNAMSPAFAALPPRRRRSTTAAPVFAYTSAPSRGLDVLLDSWPLIRRSLPEAKLLVFSSMAVYQKGPADDTYNALYERCHALPGVEHIGSLPQPALAEALQGVDALTYPSTFAETSCISAIEALAAGCLVLATDLGALKETTAGFGRLMAMPKTRAELAAAFAAMVAAAWRDVMADPRGHESRLAAQQDFMRRQAVWPARAAEWVAFLDRVIAGRS
jgi:glycosyltransferase involved in cell wall biosynthesis